jgi:hypothetical protein
VNLFGAIVALRNRIGEHLGAHHDGRSLTRSFGFRSALIAASHINLLAQRTSASIFDRSQKSQPIFLTVAAQIIIFSVIFQSIAPKFCNRALFRRTFQNMASGSLWSERSSIEKRSAFASANIWHASCYLKIRQRCRSISR